MTEKICPKCKEPKFLKEFQQDKSKRDGRCSWCRICNNERSKKWHRENREKHREYNKKYFAAWTTEQNRDRGLRQKYGITLTDYNGMLLTQGGNCAMCGETLGPCPKGKHHPVDHDHSKPRGPESVRGIVHIQCNVFVGTVERNPGLLDKAKEYLGI